MGVQLWAVLGGRAGAVAQHGDNGPPPGCLSGRGALGGGVEGAVDAEHVPGPGRAGHAQVEAGRRHRSAEVAPVRRDGQEPPGRRRGAGGDHHLAGHDPVVVPHHLEVPGGRFDRPDRGGGPDVESRRQRTCQLGPATVEVEDTGRRGQLHLGQGGVGAQRVDVGAVRPQPEQGEDDRLGVGAEAQAPEPGAGGDPLGVGGRHPWEPGEESAQLRLAAAPEQAGAQQRPGPGREAVEVTVARAEVAVKGWLGAPRRHPEGGQDAGAGATQVEGVAAEVPDEALALGGPGPSAGLVGLEHQHAGASGGGRSPGTQTGESAADHHDVRMRFHACPTTGGAAV